MPKNDLVMFELFEGKAAEALATFRQVGQEGPRRSDIAMAERTLRHATELRQALDELIVKDAQAAAYQIAEVYGWRGGRIKRSNGLTGLHTVRWRPVRIQVR